MVIVTVLTVFIVKLNGARLPQDSLEPPRSERQAHFSHFHVDNDRRYDSALVV